ncbi:MAG: hypothetical protein HYX84_01800 [Chloroflexi bacterium]|nr:hypothetical protein [Chloroflexota bacterium]
MALKTAMNQKQNYRQVPNLNFIPLEFQRRLLPSRAMLVRVSLAALIGVGILINGFLYMENLAVKADTDAAQERIEQANSKLEAANLRRGDAAKIQADIDALQKEALSLKEEWRELQAGQGWPEVLSAVFGARTSGVDLNSVTKQGISQVAISGNATSYSAVLEYRNQLLTSKEISRIVSLTSEKEGASFSFSVVAQIETVVAR